MREMVETDSFGWVRSGMGQRDGDSKGDRYSYRAPAGVDTSKA